MQAVNHLRKCMLIAKGIEEDGSVRASLARHGALDLVAGQISYKCVFWVPLPPGHRKRTRDDSRRSVVPDVRDFELLAIREGVIEEVVMNAPFPADTPDELRDRMMVAAWENLTRHRLGLHVANTERPIITPGELPAREFQRRSLA